MHAHQDPSLDTSIVPRRVRYPTERDKGDNDLDQSVAQALLAVKQPQKRVLPYSASAPAFRNVSGSSSYLSRATSGLLSSNASSDSEAEKSALRFNELAKRYEVQPLATVAEYTRNQPEPRGRLLRHFNRSSSSSSHDIVRKRSVSNLMRKQSKLALNCQSLEQLHRLGGTSLLSLPKNFAAIALTVPCCLAATGNYLALHGPSTPGMASSTPCSMHARRSTR